MALSLRPALPQDNQFVYELVYAVLFEQLCAETWDPAIRDQLLNLQIQAKHGSYGVMHPKADYAIVMLDGQRVGRMILDRSGEFYHLVDIAIAPPHRRAGIGTRLLLGLCMEAEMMHKNIRLYVSVTNPRAAALYHRLGFRAIENLETDTLMEWAPGDRAQLVAQP